MDIGQIEGAFAMGLGLWTSEEIKFEPSTGELLTMNTWVRAKHGNIIQIVIIIGVQATSCKGYPTRLQSDHVEECKKPNGSIVFQRLAFNSQQRVF